MTTNTAKQFLHLTIPYLDFKAEVEKLYSNGSELSNSSITSEEELEELKVKARQWEKNVLEFLNSSFNNQNNVFWNDFYSAHPRSFTPPVNAKLEQKANYQKEIISEKNFALWGVEKMISVCDAVKEPDKIDLKQRESYEVEDKYFLILDKLYTLYGEPFYPIKDLLIYNGIPIRRINEDREVAKELENMGFLEIAQGMGEIHVRLTLPGMRIVEQNRKPIKVSYEDIKETPSEISAKIDHIIEKLESLGVGQQIIYDELEELKELYTTLSKKNWGEVLKGKLLNMGLEKVLTKDMIQSIYEDLTNHVLSFPK